MIFDLKKARGDEDEKDDKSSEEDQPIITKRGRKHKDHKRLKTANVKEEHLVT